MEPSEISLLLLRHLARDGCTETIRTYMTECPAMRESWGASCNGGIPDVDNFRQKLLNRSVNISLIDLLSEYGRAKSLIYDLVTKLLYEWKTLSTYFLSPHDSMATQLAHITKFLETKCKGCPTETKCIGTSDYPDMMELIPLPQIVTVEQTHHIPAGHDVAVQTSEPDEEETEDLPNIVNSLLDPPVIDKIVQIANKELNRSTQSTENPTGNNTETEIDKMLLDILHGIGGGTSLPSNALNAGYSNNMDSGPSGSSTVEPQLMALFQDAQNIIVNTPIPGTLGRPEDSASKHRPCGSFLDLIETPFKSAFLSNPNTPVVKQNNVAPLLMDQNLEKLNCKTVELDFGCLAPPASSFGNLPSSSSQMFPILKPVPSQLNCGMAKQKSSSLPKYSVIKPEQLKSNLEKLRKKRDITPKIPVGLQSQRDAVFQSRNAVTQSSAMPYNPASRSASKRKFSTPVKLSPGRAMHSSVNFYCSSSSQDRIDREIMTPKPDKSSGAPETPIQIPRSSSISTPDKESLLTSIPVLTIDDDTTSESREKIPLSTINYDDVGCSEKLLDSSTVPDPVATPVVTVTEPTIVQSEQPCEVPSTSVSTALQFDKIALCANAKTPDSGFSEKNNVQKDSGGSPLIVYNRLLASVRHARPSNLFLNKKSFSTPRKKGHIRNLMFKTPPGAQSERTENSSVLSLEDSIILLKRKAISPPPDSFQPLGSKSKKRLKWTVAAPEVNLNKLDIVTPNTSESNVTNVHYHQNYATIYSPAPAIDTPEPIKVSMDEVVSKLGLNPLEKNGKRRNRKSNKTSETVGCSSKESKGTTASAKEQKPEPSRTRTRSKNKLVTDQQQEQSSGAASIASPPSDTTTPSVPKPSRRKNSKLDDHKAAEAAAIDAVPLGNRNAALPKYRVTRGKSKLPDVHQSQIQGAVSPNKTGVSSHLDGKVKSSLVPTNLHSSAPMANDATKSSERNTDSQKLQRNLLPDLSAKPNNRFITTKETRHSSQKSENNLTGSVSTSKNATHNYKTRNAVKGKGKELSAQPYLTNLSPRKDIVVDLDVGVTNEIVLRSKTLHTSSSGDADKDFIPVFEEVPVTGSGTHSMQGMAGKSKHEGKIPVVIIDSVPVNIPISRGMWSPRGDDSNSSTPIFTGKESPSKGRGKSPRKGHQQQPTKFPPRRILPKPVPPDYPRVAFPPTTPQNSSYVLSIPSATPTPTKDGEVIDELALAIRPPFISPITTNVTITTTPPKVPKLSSDSSSDFNSSSVPKTPRLKNDSGEESCSMSMNTRLFLRLGEKTGPGEAGMPIFASTPLKFGVPQTPGKTIDIKSTKFVVTEGENSTQSQSSMFDTPIKINSPVPPKNVMLHPKCPAPMPVVIPSLTITPEISFTPRKSPRKAAQSSPTKTHMKMKTPRKSSAPIKSVQKLPAKTLYEFKPIRRTPYKSPLRARANSNAGLFSSSKVTPPSLSSTSDSSPDTTSSMERSMVRNVANSSTLSGQQPMFKVASNMQNVKKIIKPGASFASLFTKSKSLIRLSQGAKRRVADARAVPSNVSAKNIKSNPIETISPLPKSPSIPTLPQQQSPSRASRLVLTPTTSRAPAEVKAETRAKANKNADVHFQFAVSGRTKQLSLSEHESILGLLQIGSLNSRGEKQVQHSQASQGLDTDLLSSIDLHKFLRTVHAAD